MAKSESVRLYNLTQLASQTGVNRSEILGIVRGLGIPIRRLGNSVVVDESEMKRVLAVTKESVKQPA